MMKKLILTFVLIVSILMCCSCTVVSPEQVGTTRYVVYDNYHGPYYRPYVTPPVYHRPASPKRPYNDNYRPHKPVNKHHNPVHKPSNHKSQQKPHRR